MANDKKRPDAPKGSGLTSNQWNLILSTLNPEIDKFAKRIGAYLPALFHTDFGNRLLGVLGGWIEGKAHDTSGLSSAVMEKFSDFVEKLSGKELTPEKAVPAVQDWMSRFLLYAEKKLQRAKTADEANTLKAELEAEFAARKAVVEMVEKAAKEAADAKKTAGPAPTEVNWDDEWETVKEHAKNAWTFIDEQAAKAVPAVQGFRNWLAERGVRR